ncbi:unnamed protein product [Acanthoscelides obtectus]|nr:unnamed protein product [Acanthoscelides obtectus]CAK1689227.1 hypothetical protein AOBTE_LOCUS37099 [Acanthoscelides obtectus]
MLFAVVVTEKHLFETFKEHDEETRLKYAIEDLINLIGLLDICIFRAAWYRRPTGS